MVTITIKDHVSEGFTNDDGGLLYDIIKSAMKDHDIINLSFEDMNAISSSFLNSSLVKIKEEIGFGELKRRFKFVKTTPSINSTIRTRFSQNHISA
ncbi:STAS-like domain-containing protein [Exiguobacterium sp. MH3]|uniref:STAS-like domain-containing protein n=1 Tax=Exiguobacterium sp. MH3 TaxID=1399115 RepID=UPI0003C3AD61|nr:STAS-like domain-containing protein [Exiguobacterium sp. MH3]AHA29514.1 DSBA oxidoreductase [Exiguobacterium sp. MH3]